MAGKSKGAVSSNAVTPAPLPADYSPPVTPQAQPDDSVPNDQRLAAWQNPNDPALKATVTAPGTPGGAAPIPPPSLALSTPQFAAAEANRIGSLKTNLLPTLAEQERLSRENLTIEKQGEIDSTKLKGNMDTYQATSLADRTKREADLQTKIDQAMAQQIDPRHYWSSAGVAGNILNAISVGLGAFGNAATGGKGGNPALELINNAITHDIDAQKSHIQNLWEGVKQQHSLNEDKTAKETFQVNYMNMSRLASLETTKRMVAANIARSNDIVVQQNGKKLMSDLDGQINAVRRQLGAAQDAAAASGAQQQLALMQDRSAVAQKVYEQKMGAWKENGVGPEPTFGDAIKAVEQDTKYAPLLKGGYGTSENQKAYNEGLNKTKEITDAVKNLPSYMSKEEKQKQQDLLVARAKEQGYEFNQSLGVLWKKPVSAASTPVIPGSYNNITDVPKSLRDKAVETPEGIKIATTTAAAAAYEKFRDEATPIYKHMESFERETRAHNDVAARAALERIVAAERKIQTDIARPGGGGDTTIGIPGLGKVDLDMLDKIVNTRGPLQNVQKYINIIQQGYSGRELAINQQAFGHNKTFTPLFRPIDLGKSETELGVPNSQGRDGFGGQKYPTQPAPVFAPKPTWQKI